VRGGFALAADSRFFRHDFAVTQNINRRAVHAGNPPGRLTGTQQSSTGTRQGIL